MNVETLIFYCLSAILLFASLRVVTARNPVHAALYLVLSFFTAAAVWLLLEAEFLAITLVLVYVGAVTVLFLFVVMTVDIDFNELRKGFWGHLPLAALMGVAVAVQIVMVLGKENMPLPSGAPASYSNTETLGLALYTRYIYPFEIAAVILLVAIVAAIALTLRKRKDTRYLDPAEQVAVRRQDRVRLIRMEAERPAAPATKEES